MELPLGLVLPTHSPIQVFDQNNRRIKSKQIVRSELWRPSWCCSLESKKHVGNKRSLEESYGHSLKPLPLLVWSGQPNEEDDRDGKKHRNSNYIANENKEEEKQVVGWPPIKSWRKKKLHQHPGGQIRNDRMPAENESNSAS